MHAGNVDERARFAVGEIAACLCADVGREEVAPGLRVRGREAAAEPAAASRCVGVAAGVETLAFAPKRLQEARRGAEACVVGLVDVVLAQSASGISGRRSGLISIKGELRVSGIHRKLRELSSGVRARMLPVV